MKRKPAKPKNPSSREQDKVTPQPAPAQQFDGAPAVDGAAKTPFNPTESPLCVDLTSQGGGMAIIGARMPTRKH